MPTYLAAIYVGEFVSNQNNTDLTVYTHKEYIDQTQYVATIAPKHLEVLTKYTEIPYMLPKMDLLAIPDFSFGAMENWGINTYRWLYNSINNYYTFYYFTSPLLLSIWHQSHLRSIYSFVKLYFKLYYSLWLFPYHLMLTPPSLFSCVLRSC